MSGVANVLIVDDDFDIRDALSDVLLDEGFAVATATDGLDALEYLQNRPAPCLILLDWMMPRCDGAQFRAEQQRDEHMAKVPVVLLTANAQAREKMEAIQADGLLTKPVELNELFETVRRFCQG